MGRSSNNTSNSSLISGESGHAYLPNFPSVPHHHYSTSPQNPHQVPSPPHHLHQTQYLSQLASAAQFYGDVNSVNGGPNLTPPTRVYSPLSHGSTSSTGSSGLSFASGSGGHTAGLIETISSSTNIGNGKFEFEDFPQESDGGPVKTTTWKDHVSVFSLEQVGVMCDVLLQEGDIPRLIELLSTTAKDFLGRSEKILRAQAHVAYHAALEDPRKFAQVYKILESHSFSPQYHAGLQKLWFNAHYKEAEITRGRPQGAVDKYRIRRKFPLPRTIWDGEETIYCFKEKSRNALRESFRLEKYPNLEEKKKLSKETGLSMTQVGNWFKNKRQREKEKEQGKQAAKRSKSTYNSPVALAAAAAMNPEFLGLMLNGGGATGVTAPHHPHHHPHNLHHHHHPSLQPQLAPMSPEEFESALRKARLAEEAPSRLGGMYVSANTGVSSTTSSPPSSGSSPVGQITAQQQQSPRSVNGLTITTIPSPNQNEGSSPSCDQDAGNAATGGSPINEDVNGGIYIRPRSNDSNLGGRFGGADPVSYYHPHHHHNQHIQHPMVYHAHHHNHHLHQAHQAMSSSLPAGYDSGVVTLIHSNAALSHA